MRGEGGLRDRNGALSNRKYITEKKRNEILGQWSIASALGGSASAEERRGDGGNQGRSQVGEYVAGTNKNHRGHHRRGGWGSKSNYR